MLNVANNLILSGNMSGEPDIHFLAEIRYSVLCAHCPSCALAGGEVAQGKSKGPKLRHMEIAR